MLALAGCDSLYRPAEPETRAAYQPDPVAEKIQDISGSLLLFRSAYHRLPQTLAELQAATGLQDAQLIDPGTGRPFRYAPDGFASSAAGGKIILLAAPGEGAKNCWAIALVPAGDGEAAQAIQVPAEAFRPADK